MYESSKLLIWSGIVLFSIVSVGGPIETNAQEWKQYQDPAMAGWSYEKLEEARKHAAEVGSAAVMIIDRGDVVAAWGSIDHPYKMASVRKSIYDATFGARHRKQRFDVSATMKTLGIDDIHKLTESEKSATFEQLMTARSGVYHPAAYETASNAALRPKRGAYEPGKFWYYNNWDYNLTTEAFQKASRIPFKQALFSDLAVPLGMEDLKPEHLFEWLEPRSSRYPAVTVRMSARDLARIGKLYVQNGKWNGKRIVSSKWIKRSVSPITTFEKDHYRGEGNGYGRMWWVFPARPETGSPYQSYHRIAARGVGNQIMVLFPEIDVVIVHLADTDTGRGVRTRDGIKLMDLILSARNGSKGKGNLGPLKVRELSGKKPVPLRDDYKKVPEKLMKSLEGIFMFNEKLGIEIYRFEKGLFMRPIGMPLGDAELLRVADGSLQNPLAPFVVKAESDGERVDIVEMTFRGQTMKGKRKP